MIFLRTFLMSFIFLFLVASAMAQGRGTHVLLYSDAIYFDSGSDRVDSKYDKILNDAIIALRSHPDTKAWIQAHTDSLGSAEDNQKLSEQRARAVFLELAKRNMDSSRLHIDFLGEYVPAKSNGTVHGRALNRRVTIDVVRPYVAKPKSAYICSIKGKVLSANNSKVIPTTLIFNSLAGKDSVNTDANGFYQYTTDTETNVEIRAYSKGHFFVSKLGKTKMNDTIEVNFMLEPAVIGGKMALNDLFFHGGTPVLLPSSEKALEGVIAFMKYNTELKIEIGGHINKPNEAPVAEDSPSFKLSKDRAAAVYTYLIASGVDKNRLTYKGYGNSEMIYPKADNPIQEQTNRRVELKVIE
jgi:outer membrane protein OmpA-like peptidoglycan-associated protein